MEKRKSKSDIHSGSKLGREVKNAIHFYRKKNPFYILYIGRSRTKLVRSYVSNTNDRLRNFELYALPAMQKKIQDQEEAIATVEAQIQGKETLSTV